MNRINEFWEKSFTDKRYRITLHVVFWVVYLLWGTHESVVINVNSHEPFGLILFGSALSLFLFYPLVYLIVPLFRGRRWLGAVLLFIVYYFLAVGLRTLYIQTFVDWYNLHKLNPKSVIQFEGQFFWREIDAAKANPLKWLISFFSSVPSMIENIDLPLALSFLRYASRINLQKAWLAKENSQLQLATLRAQLNPHFFFNTLNNLQSFIVQNEREKSAELLTRLADFMRSSLYETDGDRIPMKQEMDLLNNYILIEKVRFEASTRININLTDQDPEFRVPSFLFLPFIENVFKHAGDQTAENIHIEIELLNSNKEITLKTTNSYQSDLSEFGGIGLQNVRKRLDYYYPGKHLVNVEKTATHYTATLSICK